MKSKVIGKAHHKGVAKKTGNPHNFNRIRYTGPDRGAEGLAALTLASATLASFGLHSREVLSHAQPYQPMTHPAHAPTEA